MAERTATPIPARRAALVRSSVNVDSIFSVPAIVKPGQTISSSGLEERLGGKGANCAIAIAQNKSPTVFLVGTCGSDARWIKDDLSGRGVGVQHLVVLEDESTGRAMIQVAEDGENSIIVFKGANYSRLPDLDNDPSETLRQVQASHLVLQNEIPLATTESYLKAAHKDGIVTIFNPSPMLSKSEATNFPWEQLSVLVLNHEEATALSQLLTLDGSRTPQIQDCASLSSVPWIIVTHGAQGVTAFVHDQAENSTEGAPISRQQIQQSAFKPQRVSDTTGAGDTFLGYLVAELMRHNGPIDEKSRLPTEASDIQKLLRKATCAAAIAVERPGAADSIPDGSEVEERLSSSAL
ncbi:putative ribokinase [Tilletia horrida]|uniref:Ribokinase n=1 Tax=Tilletia horrida TaxID=155126 RepID=A0AAN6GNP3_9BASI|nr:putative ribokinase [Tilletia horrida]KAK0564653.1 putative ribokinase [Tilletia horrida]